MKFKHLEDVQENYFKHMLEAWLIVVTMLFAAVICLIHSFYPDIFQATASGRIRWILARTDKRSNKK